ncbi:PH domain-containing protein [Flavobacterium sp.]|uniref:PH domain-containing protein n=1 Tax=Flavobacterium sp. TaxID=239 RepID=UPI0026205792|nr:PH domain-containing protein [Flavobacterium sp.]
METNFSQPQRQSSIGVLVMFFDTIRHWARGLWPFLFIWIFKFNEINKVYFFLGLIAFIIIVGLVAYFKYLNFTFFLDYENEEFIINEGIFNKTRTTVQLNKIQQVNINQSLIQRIIGVYSLDVDTAGSTKKEGEIKAISHPLALELKARLLDNEKKKNSIVSENESNAITADETHPFIEISFLSLLKVGITSNYVKSLGLILAFFATMYENVNNLAQNSEFDKTKIDHYIDKSLAIQSIAIIVFMLLCSILIINLFRVIIRYFNYKISRQRGSLLLSFGLINTKSTIIKPEKVQITSVSRNYFQKKMNILELKIKQATNGEKEERKGAIEIPGCNENERDQILKLLFHKIPEKGVMLKPNFRKLVFSIFLTIVLPLIAFFSLGNYVPELLDFAYFTPLYAVFLGLIHYFGFRNYRLFIHDDFIIKQSGAWDIANEIIEPMKIQAITTSQLFWHKSADIGYLTLHTAGGNLAFQLGDFTIIKQYVNRWLYEIETSDSNWM